MDKGWSPIWAHWTPAAPVGKVRMRAQTEWKREEGHNSRIYSSSRASAIGVTLPEGPHGMVEEAARKRRCPAPSRALPGGRGSGYRTNLTRVGHCQAKSCPGQPRASLAKPLTAGKNREQGGPHPAAASNASQCQLLGGVVQPQANSMQHPRLQNEQDQHENGQGKKPGVSDTAAWVIPVPQGSSPTGKSAPGDPHDG